MSSVSHAAPRGFAYMNSPLSTSYHGLKSGTTCQSRSAPSTLVKLLEPPFTVVFCSVARFLSDARTRARDRTRTARRNVQRAVLSLEGDASGPHIAGCSEDGREFRSSVDADNVKIAGRQAEGGDWS